MEIASKTISYGEEAMCLNYRILWSNAINSGNYSEAYEGFSFASVALENETLPENESEKQVYIAGFVLGFYSSYEDYEVPSEDQDLFAESLHFASENNLPHNRDD